MSLGTTIEVQVLDLNVEQRKLSFGKKQLSEDPWIWVKNHLKAGQIVQGVVQSFVDYGVFVKVEDRVEALVYRTEVSWMSRANSFSEFLKRGEERNFLVKSIDVDARRICLSIKDLEKDGWFDLVKPFPVGTIVKGKVVNVTKAGVYVEIVAGIDAFIFFGDYAWENPDSTMLKLKQEVEFKIRKVDKAECKIYGSIREMTESPAEIFLRTCSANTMLKTTVIFKKPAGITVQVDDANGNKNVRGFLNAAEYRSLKDQRAFEPGSKLELCLQGMDRRGIALSFSLRKRQKNQHHTSRNPRTAIDNFARHSSGKVFQQAVQSTYTPFDILSSKGTAQKDVAKKVAKRVVKPEASSAPTTASAQAPVPPHPTGGGAAQAPVPPHPTGGGAAQAPVPPHPTGGEAAQAVEPDNSAPHPTGGDRRQQAKRFPRPRQS